MDNEIDNHDPVYQVPSIEKKSSIRVWVRVIVVYMIALSFFCDYYLAMTFGMALSPSFSFEFLFIVCGTPFLLLLIPSVIGLLKISRTGFLTTIIFLGIFGVIPGVIVLFSGPGGLRTRDLIIFLLSLIATLVIPGRFIYWLIVNMHEFEL